MVKITLQGRRVSQTKSFRLLPRHARLACPDYMPDNLHCGAEGLGGGVERPTNVLNQSSIGDKEFKVHLVRGIRQTP